MNKYLVVGLGNPGKEYVYTRHNVGFQLLEFFTEQTKASWSSDRYGWKAEVKIKGRTITLIKPDTYMNLSGNAVRYWIQKLNIEPQQTLVITDDLNIPFGTLRMRKNGSDGGHNGLKSIQETLQTTDYPRLRVGIGNDFSKGKQVNFVLGEWKDEEKKILHEEFKKAIEGILTWVLSGAELAMNMVNKKG